MSHIFFDESHHARGEFSLGAFVVFDGDPSDKVSGALLASGLIPGVDEYKSNQPHASDQRFTSLRNRLFQLAQGAKIGLVVAPYSDRRRFGAHAIAGLAHIIRENELNRPVVAFLDQGLFQSKRELEKCRREAGIPTEIGVVPECDSRITFGIQVADLVAHACSMTMLGLLGISDKTLYDKDEGEYLLSFEMWARLRFNFLARSPSDPKLEELARAGLMDSHNGLYIAPNCGPELAGIADGRFGQTWLGCMH